MMKLIPSAVTGPMYRPLLLLSLIGSLLMPGAIGLHVHEDGTCHSHPFDDHDEEESGQPVCMFFEFNHSTAKSTPAWFVGDVAGFKAQSLDFSPEVIVQGHDGPPRIRAPARASPFALPDSIPLFLRQRHLLI